MSETRPVPRRESPWGVSEGYHREPKAHRCNDRAEDVIQFTGVCFFLIESVDYTCIPSPGVNFAEQIMGNVGIVATELMACFEGNPFKTVPGPFKLFWQCMRSKPGEEPTEPYTYLQLDPPKREVKLE